MYRRLGDRSPPSNALNGNQSGPIRLLNSFFNILTTYKYFIISMISMFTILKFTISGQSATDQFTMLESLYPTSNLTALIEAYKDAPPNMDTTDMYTIESRLRYFFPYDEEGEIENNIWQLWKYKSDDKKFPSKCFSHMERWRVINAEYNHNLVSFDDAKQQVFDYFSYEMPEVVTAYVKLPDDRLKYEFLKYLLIYISGGLYADVDTICAKPLKYWYDSTLKAGKLFVGISIDYNDLNWDILYNRRLSFSNKIFRAKSHHPFLAKLIARITYMTLNEESDIAKIDWKKAFENVDSNEEPLIQYTGESIFTDTLFDYFNHLYNPIVHRVARTEKDLFPENIFGPETSDQFSYRLFTLAKGPTQVDDVIVMPQITFKGPTSAYHKGDLNTDSYEAEYDDSNQNNDYYYARPLHFLTWNAIANGAFD